MSSSLIDRYAMLDPAASPSAEPDWSTLAPALLTIIEEGEPIMQTTPVKTNSPQPPRRRSGILIAAATFVAVLVIVGAAFVLAGSGEETAPATTPPTTAGPTTTLEAAPPTTAASEPTTTVAPTTTVPAPTTTLPLDPTERAVADQLVAYLNEGDADALMEQIGGETLVLWPTIAAGVGEAAPLPPDRWGEFTVVESFRYFAVTNATFTIDTCRAMESGRTRCVGEHTSPLVQTQGGPSRLTVVVDLAPDGTLAYFTMDWDAHLLGPAHGEFWDWVSENYPGEERIMWTGNAYPLGDEEALALWAIRLPEYVASR